jgi:hypothetical protein
MKDFFEIHPTALNRPGAATGAISKCSPKRTLYVCRSRDMISDMRSVENSNHCSVSFTFYLFPPVQFKVNSSGLNTTNAFCDISGHDSEGDRQHGSDRCI